MAPPLGHSAPTLAWSRIVEAIDDQRPSALATVLSAQGSTPVKAGSKAIIECDGAIRGTIGGGAVEAEAQRCAIEAISQRIPIVFDFELQGGGAEDPRPICGGLMRVLVDPAFAENREAYSQAAEAHARRERGALLTAVTHGTPVSVKLCWIREQDVATTVAAEVIDRLRLHPADADAEEEPCDAIRAALASATPVLISLVVPNSQPRVEVLIEPLLLNPRLVIVGGGHVGQALALQASLVGFELLVIDDRPEFVRRELFPPGTVTLCGPATEELARLPADAETYIALMTRGHQRDAEALAACIHTPVAYLGMIGSRRKVALVRNHFLETGLATAAEFDRVFAPIGLDIGAVTVPEIAASIAAQLIAVRREASAARAPAASH